jgi:hypothetical protein
LAQNALIIHQVLLVVLAEAPRDFLNGQESMRRFRRLS